VGEIGKVPPQYELASKASGREEVFLADQIYMSIHADKDTQVGFFFTSKIIKAIGAPVVKAIDVPLVQTTHDAEVPASPGCKRKSLKDMRGSLKGASGIINF